MSTTRTAKNPFNIPDLISKARQYDQLKNMNDPSVVRVVYEEQNGTCKMPDCTETIKFIARAHSITDSSIKYFGFCEGHAQPYIKFKLLHKKI